MGVCKRNKIAGEEINEEMKKITALLLGAGMRGAFAYAPYAEKYPHELEFVAVSEPMRERREAFAKRFRIPESHVFSTWEEALAQPRIADVAIICTQDRMHYEPAMKALELGYDVLIEKPMSPSPRECFEMEAAARKNGRLLMICHVLRYTAFWKAVKRVISDGQIGQVVSIQLNENVGYYHIAHSFVRGNWRNAGESSPMILAKSCHDLDLLCWLMDQECVRLSSFGSLMHFTSQNAPEGSAERCTDGCPAEEKCPFSAPRFYLNNPDWAKFVTFDESREGILKALREGPYGRCVYRCDNNVVDHQVVNMEFANGATAMFSMCGFTHDVSRSIQIMGTKGEIRGTMEDSKLNVYDFASGEMAVIHVKPGMNGHGGGDEGIVRSFLNAVRNRDADGQNLSSAEEAVKSHLLAFAAEESRLNGGKSIDIRAYKQSLLESMRI